MFVALTRRKINGFSRALKLCRSKTVRRQQNQWTKIIPINGQELCEATIWLYGGIHYRFVD